MRLSVLLDDLMPNHNHEWEWVLIDPSAPVEQRLYVKLLRGKNNIIIAFGMHGNKREWFRDLLAMTREFKSSAEVLALEDDDRWRDHINLINWLYQRGITRWDSNSYVSGFNGIEGLTKVFYVSLRKPVDNIESLIKAMKADVDLQESQESGDQLKDSAWKVGHLNRYEWKEPYHVRTGGVGPGHLTMEQEHWTMELHVKDECEKILDAACADAKKFKTTKDALDFEDEELPDTFKDLVQALYRATLVVADKFFDETTDGCYFDLSFKKKPDVEKLLKALDVAFDDKESILASDYREYAVRKMFK